MDGISDLSEDWQSAKDFSETNWAMLKFKIACDVTFRVGQGRETIQANKFILVSRSPVFFTMFHGLLAEKEEVFIPEIEVDIFNVFLRYLYTNESGITVDNVMPLLYAAKKYAVTNLGKKCVRFLESILNVDNACDILEQAHVYSEDNLGQKALKVIMANAGEVLKSSGFKDICRSCLNQLLISNELRVDEMSALQAALWWAEAECERQGRELNSESKFDVLKDTLKYIRFQHIGSKMLENFLGNSDSKWSHFLKPYIHSKALDTGQSPRETPLSRINRFEKSDENLSWTFKSNRTDAISFSCTKPVQIHGIILYGGFPYNTKDVVTYSIVCCIEECLRQDYTSHTFFKGGNVLEGSLVNKTVIVSNKEEFIELYFAKPIQLAEDLKYTIVLLDASGTDSRRGVGGHAVLEQNGVRWSFYPSSKSKNGTDVEHGQIPGLIYHC